MIGPEENRTPDLRFRKPEPYPSGSAAPSGTAVNSLAQPEERHKGDTTELPSIPTPERLGNYIYVARARDGRLKVGVTSNLKLRLRNLASKHGSLELVGVFRAPRFWTDALRLERKAHVGVAHWRLGGEWFGPDAAMVVRLWNLRGRILSVRTLNTLLQEAP